MEADLDLGAARVVEATPTLSPTIVDLKGKEELLVEIHV